VSPTIPKNFGFILPFPIQSVVAVSGLNSFLDSLLINRRTSLLLKLLLIGAKIKLVDPSGIIDILWMENRVGLVIMRVE
jgi:hypothetical protein